MCEPAPARHRHERAAGIHPGATGDGVDLRVWRHGAGGSAHRPRPRPGSTTTSCAAGSPTAAWTSLLVRNVTDIEDKVLAKSAAAHRPWWEWAATYERAFQAAYAALGCLPPSIEPRASGHVPQMIELMERLDRLRARLRRGWRRLLRRPLLPRLRRAVRPEDRRRRPGRTGFRRQARPARLRAVEGGQARRAVVGHAVGTRAAGLAPGVLGDGHHVPRRRVRRPRRRHRPHLPAPRERAGPVARGGRPVRPLLAAQRVGHDGGREDVQVAGQHAVDRRAAAPGARRSSCATTWWLRTTGRRSSSPTPRLQEAVAAYRRIESFVHRVRERIGAPEPGTLCAEFAAAMDDDLGTPGALAAVHNTVREGNTALDAGNHKAALGAASSVRAMTAVLGLDPLDPQWAPRRRATTRRPQRCPHWWMTSSPSARRPAPAATSRPPTRCAAGSPPPGSSSRTARTARRWSLKDA